MRVLRYRNVACRLIQPIAKEEGLRFAIRGVAAPVRAGRVTRSAVDRRCGGPGRLRLRGRRNVHVMAREARKERETHWQAAPGKTCSRRATPNSDGCGREARWIDNGTVRGGRGI